MILLFENVQDEWMRGTKKRQIESEHNHPRECTYVIEKLEKKICSRQIRE